MRHCVVMGYFPYPFILALYFIAAYFIIFAIIKNDIKFDMIKFLNNRGKQEIINLVIISNY